MTDRAIIFSTPMVRALLEGRKSQTRRVLLNGGAAPEFRGPHGYRHEIEHWGWEDGESGYHIGIVPSPDYEQVWQGRYAVGNRLWVREKHARVPATAYRMSEGVQQSVDPDDPDQAVIYACGWERCAPRWRPSIHMPRWASRLTLTVTDARVQRVQEISELDIACEGVRADRPEPVTPGHPCMTPIIWGGGQYFTAHAAFRSLWDSINAKRAGCSWADNPWVVALTFSVAQRNIDRMEEN